MSIDESMPPPTHIGEPTSVSGAVAARWLNWLRAAATGILAGGLAGFVVGGVGGRLAMRLVVLATSRFPAQSPEGTLLIVFMGTVLGATGGLLYVVLRRWLPPSPLARRLSYALLLLAGPGVAFFIEGIFHADSELREGPVLLGVGLFSLLILAYGLAVAGLVEWLDVHLPAAMPHRPVTLVGYGLAVLLGLPLGLLSGLLLATLVASAVSLLITGQPVRLPSLF